MFERVGLSLNGTLRPERLTLSLEASTLRLMVVRGHHVLRVTSAALPPGVVRNGQVVETAAFSQIVARSLKEINGPRRKAIVSLNDQRALVRILNMPAVPPRLLDETVRREARRELPLPLEELYLSWQVINNSSRLQVFTVGVFREAVDNYVTGLRRASVRPATMDLKALALVRAVNRPDVLLANLEGESGSVVLVRGFIPYIVRSVVLSEEAAGSWSERVDQLVDEIQRTLDFYSSTLASDHPVWSPVVCLTGSEGGQDEVRARVGARWPLVEPDPPLSLPQKLPLLPYLVNVGLALKQVT
jgi:Tfp pilus assembly PilM family ATPase